MARPNQVFHLHEAQKELGFVRAVRASNTLYVTGTCAVGFDNEVVAPGDMRSQVKHIFSTIAMALEAHGANFENAVKDDDLHQRRRRPADPQRILRGRGAAGRNLERSLSFMRPDFVI